MKEFPVTFKSHGKQIVGMMHLPAMSNPPAVIICHGYFGSKEGAFYVLVEAAREICKKGFAVLRFDYRGSGDSEGEFDKQTIMTMTEDFDAAISFLGSQQVNAAKVGVIGHSKGGTIAILSALKHRNVKAVAAWATVADFKKLWWDEEWLKETLEQGYTERISFGYKTSAAVFLDAFKYDMVQTAKKMRKPLLLIHGSNDLAVPSFHSRLLYDAASGPKRLVKVSGADHLFVPQKHRKILYKESSDWFKKWVK